MFRTGYSAFLDFSTAPSGCEKSSVLETRAVRPTYRGGAAASANPTGSHPVKQKERESHKVTLFLFGDPDGIRYDAIASTRPRRQKQSTGLFSSATLPPVRIPVAENTEIKKQPPKR